MKYKLFRFFLKVLRSLAVKVQVGNPVRKAPIQISEPKENEKIYGPYNGTDNIFIWRLKDVLCSGLFSGALINRENLVYSRFITYPWGRDVHPVLSLPYLGKLIEKTSDKSVLLITTAAKGNYYHWMVDLLPRLLLIIKAGIPDFKDRDIILHNFKAKYEEDTLRLLGIKENKIVRIKPFQLIHSKDLIISDFLLSYAHSPFPIWKKHLLDDFKDMILTPQKTTYNKLYLLRGKQKRRCLIGEERLVDMLLGYGFHIVDPQLLTVEEQINVLAGAEVVVALHGAALTNIIFCKTNTLIIELRSNNKPPEFFSEIAKTCSLRFESITLTPQRAKSMGHKANKENLILTDENLNSLKLKLLTNIIQNNAN